VMQAERRRVLLGLLVLGALAVFVAREINVTGDITHFLPDGEAWPEVSLARELAGGELSRTLVVLATAPEGTAASDVAEMSVALEAALRGEPRVAPELAFLDVGPPVGIEESLWSLYKPRRFGFLNVAPEAVGEALSPEGLTAAAKMLKQQLASPMSSMVSRVAPEDPLLILPDLFRRLQSSGGENLIVVNGRFVTADERSAVMFLGTQSSAFDAAAMGPVLAGVAAAFTTANVAPDGGDGLGFELQLSGAARFAVRAEQAIRGDVQRVTVGSSVGLVLLLLLLFRSVRLVLLTLPVLAAGFLVGLSSCLLVFGQVHGLTLAFGASLIGVSIDYTVHFHCHQTLAPHPAGPRATLRGLWPGLSLGASTTVVGFLALLVATFPGLRELALFAASGITAALLATATFLPGLSAGPSSQPSATPLVTQRAVAALNKLLTWLGRRPRVAALPVVAAVIVSLIGLPQLTWNDDIGDLNRLDPDLVAEDEAVRQKVVAYEQGRLIVAVGSNEQAALEVNDRIAAALDDAQQAGEVLGFRSLAGMLPSAARQRALDGALRGDPQLWSRVETAFAAEGFVVDAFGPFRESLAEASPEPLQRADLLASPLEPMVRPFWVTLDEGWGVLTFVHGLSAGDALADRLAVIDGAHMVDMTGVFSAAYGVYRQRMAKLLLWGLAAVLALVWWRHRRLGPTLVAFVPAVLAAATTMALLSLGGMPMNMLSLVALLMVVSMGVDYGVFLAEAGDDPRALAATHLAVIVAALSTLMGFGLLALSDHPALLSIGVPSGLGVLLCVILAPTVRLLTLRSAESPDDQDGPKSGRAAES
jgi:predicted exporter